MKEIASKNASADFQNFCQLAFKKGAESAVFWLRGNTDHYRHQKEAQRKTPKSGRIETICFGKLCTELL